MASVRQDFNQAFRDARNSGEKTFEFRGKTYTTELAKPPSKAEVGPHGPGDESFTPDARRSKPDVGATDKPNFGRPLDPRERANLDADTRRSKPDVGATDKPDFNRKNYSMPGVRMGKEGEPAIVIGDGSSSSSETPKKQMTRPTVTDSRERANLDADTSRPSGEGMKKGGMATKNKMQKVMHEFKTGKLHSGSKQGPLVSSRKQAIAIGISESGKSKKMASGGAVRGYGLATKGRGRGKVC